MINPGLRIGRYEVRDQLGRGGFGVVHLARDVELGRDVALKVLKPEYLTKPQVVQRFLKEARAAATIGHPGIVTVFEAGQITGTGTRADGNAYIAMELLRGQTLTDRMVDRGRLALTATLAIGRQLAGALAAAHTAGIIHRDLKPDNVFLIADPDVVGGERVKILDFGVAKLHDPSETVILAEPERAEARTESTFENTHSKLMLGTPLYMSPEQARSAGKIDHRTDIYSLGCILYELACGRPPYSGDIREVLAKHRDAQVARPISIANMPRSLDVLIVRMLAKAPEERPATMTDVATALAECERDHQREQLLENAPTVSDAGVTPRPDDDSLNEEITTQVPREVMAATIRGMLPEPPPPIPKTPPARPTPLPPRPAEQTFDESTATSPVARPSVEERVTTPVTRVPPEPVMPPRVPLEPVTPRVPPAPVTTPRVPPAPVMSDATVVERPLAWHSPRVLVLAVGGLALGGVLTFLILRRDPSPKSDAGAAVTEVVDAAPASPPPPPPPDAAARVIADAAEPVDVARLRSECKVLLADSKWSEVIDCAMKLEALGDPEGATLRARATSDGAAQASLDSLERSIAAGDLDAAKATLDTVEAMSRFRKAASDAYDKAFGKSLASLVPRAQAASTSGGCKQLDRFLANLAVERQRVVEPELRRRVRCIRDPVDCDLRALQADGDNAISRGAYGEAVSLFERAYACGGGSQALTRAFLSACNGRDAAKARTFYRQFDAVAQARLSQICTRNGISLP